MNHPAAAGAAAVLPLAGAPVTWDFLGYSYHPGPVLVAVLAVAITRAIVFLQTTGRRQVILDVLVSMLCALLAALWTQAHDLDLLTAGISGMGIAAIGISIIGIAKSQMTSAIRAAAQAALKAMSSGSPPPPAP
ncbi:hypothetical protein Q5H91_04195 [Sphingomonas sp. KR1UV-12]|uniref:Holin n=1 Tax=Sphingomonas aurea TaxID=3063994 RepID=A0ABT9EHG3_9SPHN|nr:hypothetical protein [Sphingomonas sp. KR1UV-12]MDP1026403.1 hypothetical protein [Sphingomonas sp. KR1UV-12]